MQQPEIPRVSVEDLIGRQVLICMHDAAFHDLNIQGFDSARFRAVILGVDNLGLWIEHPSYKLTAVYDDEGNYIPPQNRKEIGYRAAILLIWGAVKTLIFFPDQEIVLPSEEVPVIGFSHVRERERELDEQREQADLSKKMEEATKSHLKGKGTKG
jgi:hypothetical protein